MRKESMTRKDGESEREKESTRARDRDSERETGREREEPRGESREQGREGERKFTNNNSGAARFDRTASPPVTYA